MLRIFRHYYSSAAVALCLAETSVVALVLYAAAGFVVPPEAIAGAPMPRYLAAALIPALVNAVLMYSMGLYDLPHVAQFRRALPRLIVCLCVGAPLLGRSLSVDLSGTESARQALAIYVSWTALVFACIFMARLVATPLASAKIRVRRILVLGAGKHAAEIEQLMAEPRPHTAQILGYVAGSGETAEVPQGRMKPANRSLVEIARECRAREIVVALDDRRGAALKPLLEARLQGIKVTSYLSFWEREARRVNLQALDPSWLIYADGFHFTTALNGVLKRILDIVASLALLVLTLPVLALAAIAVRLDSEGPVFYRQVRVGRNGAPFEIYKFRTMRADAEQAGAKWAEIKDPRITRVGDFMRRMRIDELPQILNVLKGEMSFVGPRPERPCFVSGLDATIPFFAERHRVRPGITGWAQINYPYGASIEDARAKLSYDLYYIKNFSFMFDLLIILSTAKAILLNKGGR